MGYQLDQTDDPNDRGLRALVKKGFTQRMIGRPAWMNNNRLVGLTDLPVKAFPR
jgi:hypothetical protein